MLFRLFLFIGSQQLLLSESSVNFNITNSPQPRLQWETGTSGVSSFTVHKGGRSGPIVASIPNADHSLDWTDTEAVPGTFQLYSVMACDEVGGLTRGYQGVVPWRVLSSAHDQGVVVYTKTLQGSRVRWQKDRSGNGRICSTTNKEAVTSFLCRSLQDETWLEVSPFMIGKAKFFSVTSPDKKTLSPVELSIPHNANNLYLFIPIHARTGSSDLAGQVKGKVRTLKLPKSNKTFNTPSTLTGSYRRQDQADDYTVIGASGGMKWAVQMTLTDLANSQGCSVKADEIQLECSS